MWPWKSCNYQRTDSKNPNHFSLPSQQMIKRTKIPCRHIRCEQLLLWTLNYSARHKWPVVSLIWIRIMGWFAVRWRLICSPKLIRGSEIRTKSGRLACAADVIFSTDMPEQKLRNIPQVDSDMTGSSHTVPFCSVNDFRIRLTSALSITFHKKKAFREKSIYT